MSTPESPALAEIDRLYAAVIEQAMELRDAFFEAALSVHEEKRGHVPLVIHIYKSSPNAWTIQWSRVTLTKPKAGSTKRERHLARIKKGPGHKYPASAFTFVKGPLQPLVKAYEAKLAQLRASASDLQKIRRQVVAVTRKVSAIQQEISALNTSGIA